MSLQYIIDGYNIIKHEQFTRNVRSKDPRRSLLEIIRSKKLCGSLKNKVKIVFDGFRDSRFHSGNNFGIEVIFSGESSADDLIKSLLKKTASPKNTIVVSDDREIKFFAKDYRAIPVGVEEFIAKLIEDNSPKEKQRLSAAKEALKHDLNYAQIEKINKELREKWLGME